MWGQVGRRRGARTPACRVETLQKPRLKSLIPKKLLERGFCRQRRSQQGTLVARVCRAETRLGALDGKCFPLYPRSVHHSTLSLYGLLTPPRTAKSIGRKGLYL